MHFSFSIKSSILRCATTHIKLLPLDALPLEAQGEQKRDAGASDRQDKSSCDGEIIRLQHASELIRRRDLFNVRGSRSDNDPRVDASGVQRNLLDKGIGEDVLCDRDGDGTSEGVEEDGHRVADRHVLLVQNDLDRYEWDLDTCTGAESSENLVSDPRGGGRVNLEGI